MGELVATRLTERQRYWPEQVQACEASGKTVAEYAMDQGIDVKAMYAGKKTLEKEGVLWRTRPSRFQRAQVVGPVGGWRGALKNLAPTCNLSRVRVSAMRLSASSKWLMKRRASSGCLLW
jgi:hypothetical protein